MIWRSLKMTALMFTATCLVLLNGYIIAYLYEDVRSRFATLTLAHESETEDIVMPNSDPGADQHPESEAETDEVVPEEKKEEALLDAPAISQHPELYNGCEITTLTMLLQYYGIETDKMSMASTMIKDPTPVRRDAQGNIIYWGDPNVGFVGDVTGKNIGLGIYHGPILEQLQTYFPDAVNLTGRDFEDLERVVSGGDPVMVWTTVSFNVPKEHQWYVWDSPHGKVRATFQMHTVLLVGYDQNYVYVNDPQTGAKAKKIDKNRFIATWEAMGKQAVAYISP
jgi:uncharacterized protein YvpB